jgi:hypothetical protein
MAKMTKRTMGIDGGQKAGKAPNKAKMRPQSAIEAYFLGPGKMTRLERWIKTKERLKKLGLKNPINQEIKPQEIQTIRGIERLNILGRR